jgi:hypothetical protein
MEAAMIGWIKRAFRIVLPERLAYDEVFVYRAPSAWRGAATLNWIKALIWPRRPACGLGDVTFRAGDIYEYHEGAAEQLFLKIRDRILRELQAGGNLSRVKLKRTDEEEVADARRGVVAWKRGSNEGGGGSTPLPALASLGVKVSRRSSGQA